jgi:hypothetical protein
MAYADPQSVTVNAVAQSLPRVSSGVNTGGFSKDDGTFKLSVSHSYGKRTRRVIRLDQAKIAADPLLAGVNVKATAATYLVIDQPITGFSNTELKQLVDGFLAYLSAATGAKVTQLLGGEN